MKNLKRRFFGDDFNNKKDINNEDVIVDMNDLKKVFREYIINKMENDMESIIKLYFNNLNKSNRNNNNLKV